MNYLGMVRSVSGVIKEISSYPKTVVGVFNDFSEAGATFGITFFSSFGSDASTDVNRWYNLGRGNNPSRSE